MISVAILNSWGPRQIIDFKWFSGAAVHNALYGSFWGVYSCHCKMCRYKGPSGAPFPEDGVHNRPTRPIGDILKKIENRRNRSKCDLNLERPDLNNKGLCYYPRVKLCMYQSASSLPESLYIKKDKNYSLTFV